MAMTEPKITNKELAKFVKLYKKNDHNMRATAAAAGITYEQVRTRKRWAITVGLLDSDHPAAKSGSKVLPVGKHEAHCMRALLEAHGGVQAAAAKAAGLTVAQWRWRAGAIEDAGYSMTVEVDPEARLERDTAVGKARASEAEMRAAYKAAQRTIADLEKDKMYLEAALGSTAEPARWTYTPPKPRKRGAKSEHIPMLFTSDFQIGEVIRPEETEHGHGYDTATFIRRYRHMIESTITLSFEHCSKDWVFPGIIYARGGDTISGGIHEELRETDDLTPIQACEIAFEQEAAGIRELAKAFGAVEVKDCGGGNHDRTTMKPRSKGAQYNFDRLISYMLRNEFKDDKRVTFQTTESMDVFFPIYNRNYLLTHGDRIGSRGGQGFVGPSATIMRGAQKVISEQGALGRRVDCVLMGHFHTPMVHDWVIVNGCLPGYSEFAKMNRMRPHPPQQLLTFHHKERGIVDFKPIILTDV